MRLEVNDYDFISRLAAVTREIRLERDLTLAEVARRGGLGRGYPGRVERGRADPTISQLARLARALGLRGPEDLLKAAESYRSSDSR